MSRIAVLGAGRVGAALGGRWAAGGHDVVFGVRDPGAPRHESLGVTAVPVEAVAGADVVVVALPWDAAELGFDGIDAGPLAASRDLEHLAMLWIRLAYSLGHGPAIAFSLLRR